MLLLIGSAKQPHSNSEMLGNYLMDRLREKGCETETIHLAKHHQDSSDDQYLLDKINSADITILSAPLYVDSLPAMVTEVLEKTASFRQNRPGLKTGYFAAIINCGFPEANHNHTAIAICRQFAKEARFTWLGGLSMGGGEILRARPLAGSSGMLRSVIRALDHAAHAIAERAPIPDEAVRLMSKPVIPRWLYTTAGNHGWKKRAKEFSAGNKLNDQPFKKKTQ